MQYRMPTLTDEDASQLITKCNEINSNLGKTLYQPMGYYSVKDITDAANAMCTLLEPNVGHLQEWSIDFFKRNRPALWLLDTMTIGRTMFYKYDRYSCNNNMTDYNNFYKNQFQKNPLFHDSTLRQLRTYELNYDEAEMYIQRRKVEIKQSPEVLIIHLNKECESYDWYDDCHYCEDQERQVQDRIEKERKQSRNIFLNKELAIEFFFEWIASIEDVERMKYAWEKWAPSPVFGNDYSPDRFLLSPYEVIEKIEKQMKNIYKPGLTAITVAKEWANMIITSYFRIGEPYNIHYYRNEPRLNMYYMFLNYVNRMELFPILIPVCRQQIQQIQEML